MLGLGTEYGLLLTHTASIGMAKTKGFGLLELFLTLALASLLFTLAIPAYEMFVDRAKVARAIGDIGSLSIAVEQFRLGNQVNMTKRTNKHYPVEFKQEAVALVIEQDYSILQAASSLGIVVVLASWLN